MMNCSPISWREQVTPNEWLLFNAKWWIVHLYHDEQQSLIGYNLFSPWYRWTIHHLALNNNHSLDVTCSRHDIGEQFIIQMMNCSPISWREQDTSNEWLLFNAKWWIVHLYHGENKLHPNEWLLFNHLALNNNHSLGVTCSRHDIGEQFIIWN
jgi:ribosomal silencing factor RsfS